MLYISIFCIFCRFFCLLTIKIFFPKKIAITDSMFNFGNFLTKNAITFDPKEIERKKYISLA